MSHAKERALREIDLSDLSPLFVARKDMIPPWLIVQATLTQMRTFLEAPPRPQSLVSAFAADPKGTDLFLAGAAKRTDLFSALARKAGEIVRRGTINNVARVPIDGSV